MTDEVTETFAEFARQGHSFNSICDYLGIYGTTFWSWIRRGESWIKGDGQPSADEPYGRFVTEVRKAFAAYQMQLVSSLHDERNPWWTKDIEILSRRDRGTWSRRDPIGGGPEVLDANERFL